MNNNVTIAVGTGQAVNVGVSAAGSAAGQTAGSAYAKAAAINAASIGGLTASADTTFELNYTTTATNGYALSINGIAVQAATTAALDRHAARDEHQRELGDDRCNGVVRGRHPHAERGRRPQHRGRADRDGDGRHPGGHREQQLGQRGFDRGGR